MHPASRVFCGILDEMKAMHLKKGADYGTDADPFSNVRASEQFGIPAWLGSVVRGNDKMSRLKTFAQKGVLRNESVEDSLLDLAVYAVIGLVLFRETQADGQDADGIGLGDVPVGSRVVSESLPVGGDDPVADSAGDGENASA